MIQRYLSIASSLSFIYLLDHSRALFYYYFIHGALFPLIKIFIFNAKKGKSATTPPPITKTTKNNAAQVEDLNDPHTNP